MERKAHWENVFSTKTEKEVSWYQEYPKTSVDFIMALPLPLDAKIIDIGGGDSYLMDALLDLGYTNLTLLDISAKAIERIKHRLGDKGLKVTFIVSDILDFEPSETYDFWHDRACFHFLTEANQIEKYVKIVERSLAREGKLLVGTFSESGPKKCSSLDIKQYNEESLRLLFEKDFKLDGCFKEAHQTPFDTTQDFLFCGFKRK
ncbi:class I SAM-dependent methyltransferase [Flavobacterium sp. J49]|uniref:class I SAM-dependent methyltransferase n=1 Tax=Flavobacterium sp. J49 TaxID=2718534 RepID=UPI0015940114|nr:class I SAM-dependent methyltransferase [Flavobacterium sp. J49]MBF6642132.1 class I SAM-dependent methyltransferase [Flavobacterium sp. J49]NIC03379.1 class I SAM-dependent methyltransferase [Flavobacterium sp. J49]